MGYLRVINARKGDGRGAPLERTGKRAGALDPARALARHTNTFRCNIWDCIRN